MSDDPVTFHTSAIDYTALLRFDWRNHWLTTAEYARHISRPQRTVQKWLEHGTLAEFHVPSYRDRRGRWWIKNVR